MNSKRPRNNRNNQRRGSGQGGRQSHTLDSTGPGMKIRGNPIQIFEKYQALARDANTAGDRVMEENYAQHAEHYYRLANSEGNQQRQQQQQQQQQQQPRQQQQQPRQEAESAPAESAPAESAPTESAPAESAPAESAPAESAAAESAANVEATTRDMAKEPQPVIE